MTTTNNSEVSRKLRAAIRAKLEELGVYVDDELPDYIMVMIANKKEKRQMKDDLSLFLNKNTEKFVDWLFDIFERLQSTPRASSPPVSASAKKDPDREKKDSVPTSKHSMHDADSKTDRKRIEAPRDGSRKEKEKERSREKERESEKRRMTEKERNTEKERHRTSRPKSDEREREKERQRERERESEATRKRKVEEDSRQRVLEKQRAKSPPRKTIRTHGTVDSRSTEKRTEGRPKAKEREERRQQREPSPDQLTDYDSDGEEISPRKKVASLVVATQPPTPPQVKVSSQVVVKRKIVERNEKDVKSAKATTTMFMRAMNAASLSAGYGCAAPFLPRTTNTQQVAQKRKLTTTAAERAEQNRAKALSEFISSDEELANGDEENDQEEEDVPSAKKAKAHLPTPLTKRNLASPTKMVEDKKEERKAVHPKFIITLTGGQKVTIERDRSEGSVCSGEDDEGTLKVVSPRKKVTGQKNEKRRVIGYPNDGEDTLKVSPPPHKPITWDGHIQLEDEEETSDDEAAIDAVLAATRASRMSSIDSDEPLPPTMQLSRGAHYYYQSGMVAPSMSVTAAQPAPPTYPTYIPTPLSQQNRTTTNITTTTNRVSFVAPTPPPNKIMERCRFWPNCKLESNCVYLHPSKNCTNFPKCVFGLSCLYIHPPCMFDRNCTRAGCPYTHSSKPLLATAAAVSTPPTASEVAASVPCIPLATEPDVKHKVTTAAVAFCHFGAGCSKPGCAFKHPKECRYGKSCMNSRCHFYHPPQPARSAPPTVTPAKYKWSASSDSAPQPPVPSSAISAAAT